MREIKLGDASAQLDNLSEDERRALRGSRFAPLSTRVSNEVKVGARIPHPGGPVATNKAAALAKFLQRKLEKSSGTASLDPVLVEAAVNNAKATLHGLSSTTTLKVRHVETFSESDKETEGEGLEKAKAVEVKGKKKKRKKAKATAAVQVFEAAGGLAHKCLLKKPKH